MPIKAPKNNLLVEMGLKWNFRISEVTTSKLRELCIGGSKSTQMGEVPDVVLEKVVDLSQDVIADVVAEMREFASGMRGSLQNAIKLGNEMGGL